MKQKKMKLKVLLPTHVLVDEDVVKVSFVTPEIVEQFYAVDEGILIKCGQDVTLSIRNAVRGPDLGVLKKSVQKQFIELEDREKMSRSALVRLEAGFVRRFMDLEKQELT
jgi:F-type H+-transporting ATPase subunit epsilon